MVKLERDKEIGDKLYSYEGEIESKLGEPLSWERLIVKERHGLLSIIPEQWQTVRVNFLPYTHGQ